MKLQTDTFEYVRRLVRDEASIALDESKRYLVETRLAPIARREGFDSVDDLVAQSRRPGAHRLTTIVVEALTTNETSWYRDGGPFELLRKELLPAIRNDRRQTDPVTILSAACSSGQEPYSIAMMLHDDPSIVGHRRVRIVALDIAQSMIDKASAGVYSQIEVNRGLPAALLAKHFRRRGTRWEISPEIKRMVEFRQANLARPWPALPPVDVLLVRNVLIYFDAATKRQVLQAARRVIHPRGWLLLGTSEAALGLDDLFVRQAFPTGSAYRPA